MTASKISTKIDKWQRRNRTGGLILAVAKKYKDDRAGYLAVLITYYGFLAIFPLMLAITTVVRQLLPLDSQLRSKLITSLTAHIPIIGSELNSNIHGLHRSGIALVVAILLTIYGMRGIANATQYSLNHMWLIPKTKRPRFPHNTLKSLLIILVVGVGFLASAVLSSYMTSLGHSAITSVVTVIVSFAVLTLTLLVTFKIGIAGSQITKPALDVALLAAVGLEILQLIGGYIVINELKHLTTLYGLFAAVLGLIFWLYIMTQIVVLAVETGTVRQMRLWPRSFGSTDPTDQDGLAMLKYKQRSGL